MDKSTTQIGVRLTEEERQFCFVLGGGNAAHGARLVIQQFMSGQSLQGLGAADHLRIALAMIEQEAQP